MRKAQPGWGLGVRRLASLPIDCGLTASLIKIASRSVVSHGCILVKHSVTVTVVLSTLNLNSNIAEAKLYHRLRIAVLWRMALENVRDKDVLALEPDLPQQRLEKFSRATYERQALLVLARAGGLADEHQLRVRIAGAEDDASARARKLGAAHAGACAGEHLLEGLAALPRRSIARQR